MSYTKGPWELDEDGWIVGGTYPVCMISLSELTERDKADARLISAAPELLDALEYCEDLLMRYEINRIDGEELSDSALIKIRAAIAKAKGEVK